MAKEDLTQLSDYIVEYFKEVEDKFNFPLNVDYSYLGNPKQKKLIKLSKVSDPYSILLKSDILVVINEDYFDNFDEQSKRILFEQEIDRILIDYDKGTIKIGKPSISTSSGIIKKFTIENVENAIHLEEEYEKQKSEKEKEKKNENKPKKSWGKK